MEKRTLNPKPEFQTKRGIMVIGEIVLDGDPQRCIIGRNKEAALIDSDLEYGLSGLVQAENPEWNLDLTVPEVGAFIDQVEEARRQYRLSKIRR